jgi:hypothetical protein
VFVHACVRARGVLYPFTSFVAGTILFLLYFRGPRAPREEQEKKLRYVPGRLSVTWAAGLVWVAVEASKSVTIRLLIDGSRKLAAKPTV